MERSSSIPSALSDPYSARDFLQSSMLVPSDKAMATLRPQTLFSICRATGPHKGFVVQETEFSDQDQSTPVT